MCITHLRGGGSTEVNLDLKVKTTSLGNYEITVKANERPSHETLPIISSDYFPELDFKYDTEVDNTAPSATYKSNTVTKVDVVFALGELSQTSTLEEYTPTFEQKLNSASNAFDVDVTSVETTEGGFDMADADAATIYNFWDQCPNPNNYTLYGNTIINAVYDWNEYRANWRTQTPFNHFFIEKGSWDITDFELSSTYSWHGCAIPSGYVFHYDRTNDTCYIILAGFNTELYKVTNVSNWLGQTKDGRLLGKDNYRGLGNVTELADAISWGPLEGGDLKVEMVGNTIKVRRNNIDIITYTDPNPIEAGGVGLFAGCCVAFTDVSVTYGTKAKTLGEAISDVAWRDGSIRFIIHATDVVPDECLDGKDGEFAYTVAKLMNSNAYLINLGNNVNKAQLDKLLKSIVQADGTSKGVYYNNTPITTAMDKSADYIIDIAKNLSKPSDYVLANTEVMWDTEYGDNEKDVPLNFGEHDGSNKQPQDKSDITLASSWGLSLTHHYTNDKSLAEKWRYRHTPTFYDNSTTKAPYNNSWLADPIEVFENPGKYRINYKRRDNPIYPNVNLADAFDSYRRWSKNYDKLDSK